MLGPKSYFRTRPSEYLPPANVRVYCSVASPTIPVVNYRIVTLKRHFSKTLLVKPSHAPLRVVTIFSPRHSSQRVLLTRKKLLWSTTIPLIKVNVCSDACYPRVSRATVYSLIIVQNAPIQEWQEKQTKKRKMNLVGKWIEIKAK